MWWTWNKSIVVSCVWWLRVLNFVLCMLCMVLYVLCGHICFWMSACSLWWSMCRCVEVRATKTSKTEPCLTCQACCAMEHGTVEWRCRARGAGARILWTHGPQLHQYPGLPCHDVWRGSTRLAAPPRVARQGRIAAPGSSRPILSSKRTGGCTPVAWQPISAVPSAMVRQRWTTALGGLAWQGGPTRVQAHSDIGSPVLPRHRSWRNRSKLPHRSFYISVLPSNCTKRLDDRRSRPLLSRQAWWRDSVVLPHHLWWRGTGHFSYI
jgi:hypothetical protein